MLWWKSKEEIAVEKEFLEKQAVFYRIAHKEVRRFCKNGVLYLGLEMKVSGWSLKYRGVSHLYCHYKTVNDEIKSVKILMRIDGYNYLTGVEE